MGYLEDDLKEENTMLKEAVDDLMEENERLRKENKILNKKLEVKK
ncbi:MAG: hypothetical protein ACTSPO_16130 [Candidatus Heimdallarchaeaceae archaeon]